MSTCKTALIVPIFLYIIASVICGYADEEYEDLIDITESSGKIYAFVASGKSSSFDLKARESVKWHDSEGFLGAFLTNFRFFVVSDTSDGWQVFSLRLNEAEESVASLSAKVALLATGDRAIAFDAATNRFIETQIPIRDKIVSAETGDHIAVVITSSRAFAMATGSSAFAKTPFKLGETVESIKITSTKASVTTQDRLLIFVAQRSAWIKHHLN